MSACVLEAMAATSIPHLAVVPTCRDVVLALSWTSWDGALARGLVMPEDRLAEALPEHPRVGRLLVGNPPRSLLARAVRDPLGRARGRYPGRALHEPLRLRRGEPQTLAGQLRAVQSWERSLARAAARRGLERPAVIATHPVLAAFGDFTWARSVTYYAWDDWSASVPHQQLWPTFELAFAVLRERGRRVCAVSDAALEAIAPAGPHAVVPNGLRPEEWRTTGAPPAWFLRLPRPRMLYVGSLDDRLDLEQVRRLAAAFPQGSVSLVGPLLDPAHYAALEDVANVGVHGREARAALTGMVAAADLGILPHVRTRMTEAMSPLKLYEYLAAGRPVVATDLPGIRGVHPVVELVRDGGDPVAAAHRALRRGPMGEAERLAFIDRHAWEERFDRILDLAFT
jgi:teichuronic acid biosynthesis glycosyltransferase TuaH